MANFLYRRDTILRVLGNHFAPGSGYTVTVYEAGGVCTTANSGAANCTVNGNHGLATLDAFMLGTDTTKVRRNITVSGTTISWSGGLTVAAGDKLVNLGPEPTTSPSFLYSGIPIYTRPDTGALVGTVAGAANWATVSTDSSGNYEYWHQFLGDIWEVIRDSSGTVVLIVLVPTSGGAAAALETELNARAYVTAGSGTRADPWTGWEPVVAAAFAAGAGSASNMGFPHVGIHFPGGFYSTVTSGVFSPNFGVGASAFTQFGIHVRGDGKWNSVISLGAIGSTDTWLFDNYPNNTAFQSASQMSFSDLHFRGTPPTTDSGVGIDYGDVNSHGKGFRVLAAASGTLGLTNSASINAFVWHDCVFSAFDECFHFLGTNLASEMSFTNCYFERNRNRIFYLSNLQGQNLTLTNCNIFINWADTFVIGQKGYLNINVLGGFINQLTNSTKFGTKSWVIRTVHKAASSALTGYYAMLYPSTAVPAGFEVPTLDTTLGYSLNPPIAFRGVCFEFQGNDTGLLDTRGSTAGDAPHIHVIVDGTRFRRPAITGQTLAFNYIVLAGEGTRLAMDRCTFFETGSVTDDGMGFKCAGPLDLSLVSNTRGSNQKITFKDCNFPQDWWDPAGKDIHNTGVLDKFATYNTYTGVIEAVDCLGQIATATEKRAVNWVINNLSQPYRASGVRTMSITLSQENGWATVAAALSGVLPSSSVLRAIHSHYTGVGNADQHQYSFTNDGGTVIYGRSYAGREGDATTYLFQASHVQNVSATGLNVRMGTTVANRTVKLAEAGVTSAQNITGSLCIVEYS